MIDLKSLFTGGADAYEEITTTTIGCREEGEEIIEVTAAMPWHEGELHPAREMSMGGSELQEDYSFGGRELPE